MVGEALDISRTKEKGALFFSFMRLVKQDPLRDPCGLRLHGWLLGIILPSTTSGFRMCGSVEQKGQGQTMEPSGCVSHSLWSLVPSLSDEQLCYLRFCHPVDFHYEWWKEKVGKGLERKIMGLALRMRDSLISFIPFSFHLSAFPIILEFYHSGECPSRITSGGTTHFTSDKIGVTWGTFNKTPFLSASCI